VALCGRQAHALLGRDCPFGSRNPLGAGAPPGHRRRCGVARTGAPASGSR